MFGFNRFFESVTVKHEEITRLMQYWKKKLLKEKNRYMLYISHVFLRCSTYDTLFVVTKYGSLDFLVVLLGVGSALDSCFSGSFSFSDSFSGSFSDRCS